MTAGAPDRRSAVIAGHTGDLDAARGAWGSEDPSVRAAALGALARLDALGPAILLDGLSDPDSAVIRRAATLAGRSDDGETAVDERLLTLLCAADEVIAEVAAWALGERHENAEPSEVATVVSALSSAATGHGDALVREAAVAALGSVGAPDGLAAVLIATADKATVRRRAVIALAAFEGPAVDEALARARTDRDWQVRQAAEDLSET